MKTKRLKIKDAESTKFLISGGHFVVAEPHDNLRGAWVKSQYNKDKMFTSKLECQIFIDMNKNIPPLFKTTLRPKLISEIYK